MKQITVYGLLGKIKNGNIPNKISFDGNVYKYHDKEHGYCRHAYDNTYVCLNSEYYLFDILNDEVEIIEENNKIEKLEIKQDTPSSNFYIKNENGTKCALTKHSKMIADKLNELVDTINEMKKGE